MRINGINFSPPYMRAEGLEKQKIHRKEELKEYLAAKDEFLKMEESLK